MKSYANLCTLLMGGQFLILADKARNILLSKCQNVIGAVWKNRIWMLGSNESTSVGICRWKNGELREVWTMEKHHM